MKSCPTAGCWNMELIRKCSQINWKSSAQLVYRSKLFEDLFIFEQFPKQSLVSVNPSVNQECNWTCHLSVEMSELSFISIVNLFKIPGAKMWLTSRLWDFWLHVPMLDMLKGILDWGFKVTLLSFWVLALPTMDLINSQTMKRDYKNYHTIVC